MFWSGAGWGVTVITTKYSQGIQSCLGAALFWERGCMSCPEWAWAARAGRQHRATTLQRDTRQAGETSCPLLLHSTSHWFTVQRQPPHFICGIQRDPHSPPPLGHFPSRVKRIQQWRQMSQEVTSQHLSCTAYNLATTHGCWRLSFPKIRMIQS